MPRSVPLRAVEGEAALGDVRVQAPRLELARLEDAREEAALVREALGLDDESARRGASAGRSWRHESTVTRGIGTTKRPPQSRT